MTEHAVTVDVAERVARITLNRPDSLNAWNEELGRDLAAALDRAREDDVRAVLITGAGRAFSSGADLGEQRAGTEGRAVPDLSARLRELYNPIILAIRELPKPVVAAVNGPAAGIGCALALACDLIVAAESSFFLLAFVNIGLVPDGGATATVPARIGAARAAEMAMLGERVPAPTALEWGLINRVVPDDELDAAADTLARPARGRPDRLPTAGSRSCSTAASTPVSPGSSTPRPPRSASRAAPPTSSRACSRSARNGRPRFTGT